VVAVATSRAAAVDVEKGSDECRPPLPLQRRRGRPRVRKTDHRVYPGRGGMGVTSRGPLELWAVDDWPADLSAVVPGESEATSSGGNPPHVVKEAPPEETDGPKNWSPDLSEEIPRQRGRGRPPKDAAALRRKRLTELREKNKLIQKFQCSTPGGGSIKDLWDTSSGGHVMIQQETEYPLPFNLRYALKRNKLEVHARIESLPEYESNVPRNWYLSEFLHNEEHKRFVASDYFKCIVKHIRGYCLREKRKKPSEPYAVPDLSPEFHKVTVLPQSALSNVISMKDSLAFEVKPGKLEKETFFCGGISPLQSVNMGHHGKSGPFKFPVPENTVRSVFLNVGGIAWTLDWCPGRFGCDQYLAVGPRKGQSVHSVFLAGNQPGVIQLWRIRGLCNPLDNYLEKVLPQLYTDKHNRPSAADTAATVDYCILVESQGRVQNLKWAPNTSLEPSPSSSRDTRLGLLAAAFESGVIHLYSLYSVEDMVRDTSRRQGSATVLLRVPPVRTFQAPGFHPTSLALALCQGRLRVVAGCLEGAIVCFGVSEQEERDSFPEFIGSDTSPEAVTGVMFSNEANCVAGVGHDPTYCFKVWDVRFPPRPMAKVNARNKNSWATSCARIGEVKIVGHQNGDLSLIKQDTKEVTRKSLHITDACIWTVAVNQGSGALAVSSSEGRVRTIPMRGTQGRVVNSAVPCIIRTLAVSKDANGKVDRLVFGEEEEAGSGTEKKVEDPEVIMLRSVYSLVWNPTPTLEFWLAMGGGSGLVELQMVRQMRT